MSLRQAVRKLTGSPVRAGTLQVSLGRQPVGRRAAVVPLPYARMSSLHFDDPAILRQLIEDLTVAAEYLEEERYEP